VRFSAVLLLALALAACNSASKNNDAVRQGVIDYVASKGLNVQGMDVSVEKLTVNGSQADATVSFAPKGSKPMMSKPYHLERRDNKWVVTGSSDVGNPHGGGAMPPSGAMPPGHPSTAAPAEPGAGKMPSPTDLPPARKQ
jgi:hypothetical protein